MLKWLRRAIFGLSYEERRRAKEEEYDILMIDIKHAIQMKEKHRKLLEDEAAELRANAKKALMQGNKAMSLHYLKARQWKISQMQNMSGQILQLSMCYDQMTNVAKLQQMSDCMKRANAYVQQCNLDQLQNEYDAEARQFIEQNLAIQQICDQVEQFCDSQLETSQVQKDLAELQDELVEEVREQAPPMPSSAPVTVQASGPVQVLPESR